MALPIELDEPYGVSQLAFGQPRLEIAATPFLTAGTRQGAKDEGAKETDEVRPYVPLPQAPEGTPRQSFLRAKSNDKVGRWRNRTWKRQRHRQTDPYRGAEAPAGCP